MKSKLVIAGLIVMAAVILASLSSAMATEQTPPLTVSTQDVVWTVDVKAYGFSGKDVIDVKAEYYFMVENPDPNGPPMIPQYGELFPMKISYAECQIKMWFDPAGFPSTAVENFVTVTFADNSEQVFSGPGWTFRTK